MSESQDTHIPETDLGVCSVQFVSGLEVIARVWDTSEFGGYILEYPLVAQFRESEERPGAVSVGFGPVRPYYELTSRLPVSSTHVIGVFKVTAPFADVYAKQVSSLTSGLVTPTADQTRNVNQGKIIL